MYKRSAIIGGGGWGLTIANLLAEKGLEVLVWEHNPAYVRILTETHNNPELLPNLVLPASVIFTNQLSELISFRPEVIVLATPSQYLRPVMENLLHIDGSEAYFCSETRPQAIVNLAKGIEEQSLYTMSQVLRAVLPSCCHQLITCLSGPSHAEEVAKKIPTAVVIAGEEDDILHSLQELFSTEYFRVYRSQDLIGVEIGAAVKNIIALAAGVVDGLGFGDNTKGALLTRGIVEIQRLGVALGASPETFLGLSGIGDLITTSISQHSRNRYVGNQLAKGKSLAEILDTLKMVAEGVTSTRSVYNLAKSKNVEMPIVEQIFQVLYQDKKPEQAIRELMTRELKSE